MENVDSLYPLDLEELNRLEEKLVNAGRAIRRAVMGTLYERRKRNLLGKLMIATMLEGAVNHPEDMVPSKLGREDIAEHMSHHSREEMTKPRETLSPEMESELARVNEKILTLI